MEEKFTYFWKDKSPFSQWNKHSFEIDGVHYKTAEHYMMAEKARLFKDKTAEEEAIKAHHPRGAKWWGRQVKGFRKDIWNERCKQIVYDGNYAKFTQNEECYKALMDTKGTTLVEASPKDDIWGIGLEESDSRAKSRDTWQGTNWLGEVLTKLREDLIKESEDGD